MPTSLRVFLHIPGMLDHLGRLIPFVDGNILFDEEVEINLIVEFPDRIDISRPDLLSYNVKEIILGGHDGEVYITGSAWKEQWKILLNAFYLDEVNFAICEQATDEIEDLDGEAEYLIWREENHGY